MTRRLQIINIAGRESPTGALAADLGLQVAGFPAGAAIVNTVFAEADFIEALAQRAVFVAGAASLRLVANHAHEFFSHGGRLSRFRVYGNRPMVDDLAVDDQLPNLTTDDTDNTDLHGSKKL
jgi:hypothetical protein